MKQETTRLFSLWCFCLAFLFLLSSRVRSQEIREVNPVDVGLSPSSWGWKDEHKGYIEFWVYKQGAWWVVGLTKRVERIDSYFWGVIAKVIRKVFAVQISKSSRDKIFDEFLRILYVELVPEMLGSN